MDQQFVIFELGNEYFGVNIGDVESIVKMQAVTVLPKAPAFVEGITNLRGAVLPVIDLRKRFGMPEAAATKNSRIVVVVMGETKVGMVVDGVSEVFSIPEDAIEATPPMATGVNAAFLSGIAKLEGRLVILLDLSKVLSVEEQQEIKSLPAAV
jgi:purine-binding chemotaxis protein CheW